MKKTIIKFFDKIILFILGFSGVIYSCAKYGMPETEYEIKGVVMDRQNSKPIQNIRIVRGNYDTLYTDSKGEYSFRYYEFGNNTNLKVEDVDGELNGGDFQTEEFVVNFTDIDMVKKAKRNKSGDKYVKNLNIKLTKKDAVHL